MRGMSEARLHQWTLEEFLAWEERQPAKYEFVNGEPRLMTGVTLGHDQIFMNVAIALGGKLRGSPCRPRGSDVRVVTGNGNVRYPDVVVDCGPFRREARDVAEPVVILEVLSRTTAWTDLHDKLRDYDATPAVQRYVVIAQDEPKLVVWERDPSGRLALASSLDGLDGTLALAPIEAELRMADTYEGLGFEPAAATP
jgi:Uma2 family endonuclease